LRIVILDDGTTGQFTMSRRPLLSIVTGCYNEEENVADLYRDLVVIIERDLSRYDFEVIFIDNASEDRTVARLKELARLDKRLKIIINNRNFGHIRSIYHGMLQARGQAVIAMASDFQDPPSLIPQLIEQWEAGFPVVLAQKTSSRESKLFYWVRTTYYSLVARASEVELVKHVTGFGVYDRQVIEQIRQIQDPYPYLRGMVCDLGYSRALIPFEQPTRRRGFSKNNFFTLWDLAMLGFTNHSKAPLRLATFVGFGVALISFLLGFGYLISKLLFWDQFQLGIAPLIIGMFFIGAVQLLFIGVLGEYIGAIHTQILRRPPVVERERINFDAD
jgi:glycosyltransferase involved in cell wall biosynthesis